MEILTSHYGPETFHTPKTVPKTTTRPSLKSTLHGTIDGKAGIESKDRERERGERKSNLRTAEVTEGKDIMEKAHNKMIAAYTNEAFLNCRAKKNPLFSLGQSISRGNNNSK